VQQLVIENVVLAGVGGVLGLAFSAGLHRALPSVLPADFPRLDTIGFTWNVAVFAALVAAFVGVAVGLLPALRLRRLRLVDGLVEHSGGAIGGTRARARTMLMVGQVAAACALLVVGSLLVRSFRAMTRQDRGFVPENVLTARLGLPDYAFKPDARRETLDRFLERARALPGTPAVALTTGLPLSGSETLTAFTMPSLQPPVGKEIVVNAVRSVVTAGYFEALGLRLVQGRTFQATDDSEAAPKVVLVNRTFARQYLTSTAIGDRVSGFMRDDGVQFDVIGIVEDTMRKGLTDATQPEIYSLVHQSGAPAPNHELVLRTTGDPEALIQPLRTLVRELSPFATVESVRTMEARIAGSLARPRLYALVLLVFAISAVVIASVGLFGVLSYAVAQRTREVALRSALGARPAQICALILRQGMAVTLVGIGAGLVIAYASVGYLRTMLYGVSSHDLTTFLAAPIAIALLALAACAAPAVRALRVDPIRALRS
jgi:putative ABC transport system permease protein